MNPRRHSPFGGRVLFSVWATLVCTCALAPNWLHGQGQKRNPVSKMYVSDVSGEALIDTGEVVEDLNKRSVYSAEGTVIETKRPQAEADRSKCYSTMVYSNGTGAFFDADTRVEVRRFIQEPFVPNRMDVDVEAVDLADAGIHLARQRRPVHEQARRRKQHDLRDASRLGEYPRPQDRDPGGCRDDQDLHDRWRQLGANGAVDMGARTVQAGQQAIIRRAAPGQPPTIEIRAIPRAEMAQLDDKVSMACMAKKTVYFEVRDRPGKGDGAGAETAFGETSENSGGRVTAFDGKSGASGGGPVREIVPVEVVPTTLPVEFTVSPARLTTPGNGPPVRR